MLFSEFDPACYRSNALEAWHLNLSESKSMISARPIKSTAATSIALSGEEDVIHGHIDRAKNSHLVGRAESDDCVRSAIGDADRALQRTLDQDAVRSLVPVVNGVLLEVRAGHRLIE